MVVNRINATVRFNGNEGRVEDTDRFDLWRSSHTLPSLPVHTARAHGKQGLRRFQDQRLRTGKPPTSWPTQRGIRQLFWKCRTSPCWLPLSTSIGTIPHDMSRLEV